MEELRSVFCPAKLNLFLDVNGIDGNRFHRLTSLTVRVDFGDKLWLRFAEEGADGDFLSCDVAEIPTDERNSLLRALELFRQVFPFPRRLEMRLEKNIPVRSGLGGGSSDAAQLIYTLNRMLGQPLDRKGLIDLAAAVGRDCPLFLGSSPCIVRGTGERIDAPENFQADDLAHMKFLLFKPIFDVSTAWAYEVLDRSGMRKFISEKNSDGALQSLLRNMRDGYRSGSFRNVFQDILCEKFMELQRIFVDLPEYFHLDGHLTGTGSCGFVPMEEDADSGPVQSYLREVLGEGALIREVRPIIDLRSPLADLVF
ncbi:MAG: 4-(cytidine 5'-diphospho)-2-C-methyl-D-erythritol kinase [Puniceicoccales bacterium]|jgi:4-diphosphocytidyl-2-C-methyl-D-erythritol kinase|nr:4-(cytidine 5'-diphospho)-2-C-methyl-D-erythritol kinase [Puniceicoccales bacterium]